MDHNEDNLEEIKLHEEEEEEEDISLA